MLPKHAFTNHQRNKKYFYSATKNLLFALNPNSFRQPVFQLRTFATDAVIDLDAEKEYQRNLETQQYEENLKVDQFSEYKKAEEQLPIEPLYNTDQKLELQKSITNLKQIHERLKSKIPSIMDLEESKMFRFKEINDDKFRGMHLLSDKFIYRMDTMGINAKNPKDMEMRFEALKRDYLKYRRRRVYQQLLEKGITTRKPRRVTKQQYIRFKNFLRTGKYEYGLKPGPTYVRNSENVLVRRDIFDNMQNQLDTIQQYAIWKNKPNIVEQNNKEKFHLEMVDIKQTQAKPNESNNVEEEKEFVDGSRLTIESLAKLIRTKTFSDWLEKRDQIFSLIKEIQFSIQAQRALRENLNKRLEVIYEFENEKHLLEYEVLASKKFESKLIGRQFTKPLGDQEKYQVKGFLLKVENKLDDLNRQRLLLKSELEQNRFDHTDKLIAEASFKARIDRENDEDSYRQVTINPVAKRYVLNATRLTREQRRLVNPDLFLRFRPCDQRHIENGEMFWINRQEQANREASAFMGIKDLGAHRTLNEVLRNPTNFYEHRRAKIERSFNSNMRSMMFYPRFRQALSVLNGIPLPRQQEDLEFNPYVFEKTRRMESILMTTQDDFKVSKASQSFNSVAAERDAMLNKQEAESNVARQVYLINNRLFSPLSDPDTAFSSVSGKPLIDLVPSQAESDYLDNERHIDHMFASLVVRWYANPELNSNFGDNFNVFRHYWIKGKVPTSQARIGMNLLSNSLPPDNFIVPGKPLNYFFVNMTRPGRMTPTGRESNLKALQLCGNSSGAIGFGTGKGPLGSQAHDDAKKQARENMIYVPRYKDSALFHNLEGKQNRTIVRFKATPPGYGIIAPPLLRAIIELVGIQDVTGMYMGNRNPISVIKAAFVALTQAQDLDTIAWTRGQKLIEMCGEVDGNSYHLPLDFHKKNINDARKMLNEYKDKFLSEDDSIIDEGQESPTAR